IYGTRTPTESAARITPLKVTPVKVFRSNLTQDFNFVFNDKNVPMIVPKVSVVGDDYNLIQNSIAKSSVSAYTVSSVSSVSQQPRPAASFTQTRKMGQKRVDFAKPASELQVKRADLVPRKIMPKPQATNSYSTTT